MQQGHPIGRVQSTGDELFEGLTDLHRTSSKAPNLEKIEAEDRAKDPPRKMPHDRTDPSDTHRPWMTDEPAHEDQALDIEARPLLDRVQERPGDLGAKRFAENPSGSDACSGESFPDPSDMILQRTGLSGRIGELDPAHPIPEDASDAGGQEPIAMQTGEIDDRRQVCCPFAPHLKIPIHDIRSPAVGPGPLRPTGDFSRRLAAPVGPPSLP